MLDPDIQIFESLDSTQLYAKAHLFEFDEDKLTVIWAHHQSQGIGRKERKWISKKGNLFFTFCFFTDENFTYQSGVFVLALSVVKVLKKHHINVELKWPNDLLLSRKKMGGILADFCVKQEKRAFLIGLGLNVNLKDVSLIDKEATSLFLQTHKTFNEEHLGLEIIAQFQKDLSQFFANGFDPFYEDLLVCMVHKPKDRLVIEADGKKIEANFHTITKKGYLEVKKNHQLLTFSDASIYEF